MSSRYAGHFYYDEKAGFLATLCQLRRTILTAIVFRRVFWLVVAFHALVRFVHNHESFEDCMIPGSNLYIGVEELSVIGAFTIFFEVFYTKECWKRCYTLYGATRMMLCSSLDYILELRVIAGRVSKAHTRLSCRYVVASVLVLFYEMDEDIQLPEWDHLLKLKLLNAEEVSALRGLSPQEKTRTLVQWSADVASLSHALAMRHEKSPADLRNELLSRLNDISRRQSYVRDLLGMPVPFEYYHLLTFMVSINLVAWAYWTGCAASPVYTCVFVVSAIVYIGMMHLAADLSNPFGEDEVDFPIGAWLVDWLRQCVALAEYDLPGEHDSWSSVLEGESRLAREYVSVNLFLDSGFVDAPRSVVLSSLPQVAEDRQVSRGLLSRYRGSSSDDD